MQIWPGEPFPLGATYDGDGHQLLAVLRGRDRRRVVPVRRRRAWKRSVNLPEVTALCWHGYLPGHQAGPALRLPGARPVGTRTRGTGAIPTSCCWIPTRRRSTATWAWHESMFPYHFDNPDGSKNDLDSAAHMPKSVVVDQAFDWEGDAPPRTPWHKTIVYETHVKGFTMRTPEAAGARARHLRRPRQSRHRSTTCRSWASPRSSCCRSTSSCRTRCCSSAACATTGATTRSATSRRTTSTRRRAPPASRCRNSRGR